MMHNKWSWKRLFLAGVFSAATYAACFAIGNAITLAAGPGTSGVFTVLLTTILVVICARIVETRGVFVVLVGLFTLLAWPTNMFGPPGPQKIAIGLLTGLVYDLVWNITGRRKYSLHLAAAFATAFSIALICGLLFALDHPKKEYLLGILKFIIPIYAVLGAIGAAIGNWIYDKSLSRLAIIKQVKA